MTVNLKPWRAACCGLVLLMASFMSVAEAAQEVPIVAGDLWTKSSHAEKLSYIVGISNLLDVEYAYQTRSKNPPDNSQTIIRRLYEDVDEETLDGVIGRIDAWYAAYPNRQDQTALEIIWTEFVKK